MSDADYRLNAIAATTADRILREQGAPWAIINWACSTGHTIVWPTGRVEVGVMVPYQDRQRFESIVKLMLTAP